MNILNKKTWSNLKWHFYKRILKRKRLLCNVQEHLMYLDLQNEGISHTLAVQGVREADKVEIVERELKEGATVLDCGSNIGCYPLLEASIVKKTGRVFAFEPDVRNYELLLKNISINQYNKIIEPFNMALSDKSGEEQFLITTRSNLSKVATDNDKEFLEKHSIEECIKIKSISIDDFCKNKNWVFP